MAIRLRQVSDGEGGVVWVALCAARTVEKPGDLYLDDSQHDALANKFARDYNEMFDVGVPGVYDDQALVDREESGNPARDWWDSVYGKEQLMGFQGLTPAARPVGTEFEMTEKTARGDVICHCKVIGLLGDAGEAQTEIIRVVWGELFAEETGRARPAPSVIKRG